MVNEMLGNQYFMARDYRAAEIELAPCLQKNPESKPIKRKLIICYTQLGDVVKALQMFNDLIHEDIEFVINADEVHDDCPCPELLNTHERNYLDNGTKDNFLILGILWLYCDVGTSLKYFREAFKLDQKNDMLKIVINYIEEYKNAHPVKN